MRTVNMHEAKTNLSKLVEAVERGETVVIARGGKPAARLVPLERPRRGWSEATRRWLASSEPLELDVSRDDLPPAEERDLF